MAGKKVAPAEDADASANASANASVNASEDASVNASVTFAEERVSAVGVDVEKGQADEEAEEKVFSFLYSLL